MNKDIESYNDKGQRHGYWESYYNIDTLLYKCYYVNDLPNGYEEFYHHYHNEVDLIFHL